MFGIIPNQGVFSIDAVIRDRGSSDARARTEALLALAETLQRAVGVHAPTWRLADRHPRGPEIAKLLRSAIVSEEQPELRGEALVGLATIGAPDALSAIELRLDIVDLREFAVLALGVLGEAARAAIAEHDDATDSTSSSEAASSAREVTQEPRERAEPSAHEVVARATALIRSRIEDDVAEIRFQAALASVLVLEQDEAEVLLAARLAVETEPRGREALLLALSAIDGPAPATCDAVAAALRADAALDDGAVGLSAALWLTGAGRRDGADRLLRALDRRFERDDALEGLAVLGTRAPREAVAKARSLANGWFVPAVSRVRAAYALARIAPDEGRALLDRWRRSWRPAVREAVADADANLVELAARDGAGDAPE
jgi:hypothetical protein